MRLRTKIDVTYNSGVTGTATGIVEGILESTALMNDFNTVGANYLYGTVEGDTFTPFHNDGFAIDGEMCDQLYNMIKGNIPEGLEFRDTQRWMYYLAFAVEMANTFGIEVSDIEIVA